MNSRRAPLVVLIACFVPAATAAQQPGPIRPDPIVHDAAVLALTNVRVIDGTGAPPLPDQSLLLADGKIRAVGPSAEVDIPPHATILDLRGRTVVPGLVMLHEHLMYFSGRAIWHAQPISYPPLYLAAGVTTIRTAGTEHPEVERNLRRRIESGKTPGPKIHLTMPYLNGEAGDFLGDTVVETPEEARAAVAYWARRGFTSVKLYDSVSSEVMGAAIDEAHRRGLTVTGHLGSIGCAEAADLGIDFIEHAFASCRQDFGTDPQAAGFKADLADPRTQALIRHLVAKGVVLVATPIPTDRPISEAELELMHPHTRETYLRNVLRPPPWWPNPDAQRELRKLERAFVAAGGKLAVGADAADFGQIAGYANHRVLEMLAEAGWQPLEIIRLVTSEAAEHLGVGDSVGRIAPGWAADLVVVRGDPSTDVRELSEPELVFKDGVAFDPVALRAPLRGLVGWH